MIIFTKVRWKNFLSTGNTFTEIFLDKNPSTLIIGENGAGKSTILDALCFGLFNNWVNFFDSISSLILFNSIPLFEIISFNPPTLFAITNILFARPSIAVKPKGSSHIEGTTSIW